MESIDCGGSATGSLLEVMIYQNSDEDQSGSEFAEAKCSVVGDIEELFDV